MFKFPNANQKMTRSKYRLQCKCACEREISEVY